MIFNFKNPLDLILIIVGLIILIYFLFRIISTAVFVSWWRVKTWWKIQMRKKYNRHNDRKEGN